jgi:hypothetical protein
MATTNDNLEIQKQDRVVVVVLGRLEGLPSCLMDAFRSYFRSDTMDRLFLQRKLLRGDELLLSMLDSIPIAAHCCVVYTW